MAAEPVVIKAGRGRQKSLRYGRGTIKVLVDQNDGAVNLDVHVNEIQPGTPPGPRHYHTGNENAYFVLSGIGLIGIGDDEITVNKGDFVYIPPGVPHWVHNSGAAPLQVIEIYAPSTIDFIEV